jgi:hypothetical protein
MRNSLMALALVAGCDDVKDTYRMATSMRYDAAESPLAPELVDQLDELTVQYGVVESGHAGADFYKDENGNIIDQRTAIHDLIVSAGCEDASDFETRDEVSDPMLVTSDVRIKNCKPTRLDLEATADNR